MVQKANDSAQLTFTTFTSKIRKKYERALISHPKHNTQNYLQNTKHYTVLHNTQKRFKRDCIIYY